jgi:fatty-acyl-CoA synthase
MGAALAAPVWSVAMKSTMQDVPLLLSSILRRGSTVHADSSVTTIESFDAVTGALTSRTATFAEIGANAARLAHALRKLGITGDQRVGTFCWNHQEHLECYLAIPSMGAVLHTLNIRLFPEQLTYVVNHADDRVIITDGSLIPLLCKVAGTLPNVEHFVVVGEGDHSMLGEAFPGAGLHDYATLLGSEPSTFPWPEDLDERDAAAMCYTSGTTGNPKGVAYSHRSTYMHSLASLGAPILGLDEPDRALVIVPMFHANAWGMPYSAFFCGADFVFPKQFLQAAPLAAIIAATRPTVTAAVPTIWNDMWNYGEQHPLDLSSMRSVTSGGAAVPRVLMQRFKDKYGLQIMQGWGMTETSPLGSLAKPHKFADVSEHMNYHDLAGRMLPGVELRIVNETTGEVAPTDGTTIGEIEVRGPWITGSYHLDATPEKFRDGWLRTGDMGTLDAKGYLRITDRTKDVIKSGGEWVSSIDLENVIMAHPAIAEAAVIGVPDPRWDERPMACLVVRPGASVTPEEVKAFLGERVAKWWIPERWTFIDAVPKTSVGKFDKKVLRAQHAEGLLTVLEV